MPQVYKSIFSKVHALKSLFSLRDVVHARFYKILLIYFCFHHGGGLRTDDLLVLWAHCY